jgi:hypothetical protein
LLRSGLDPATAAAKLNSEGYKMDVRSAFTAAQPGIIDISGLKPLTTAGVQETAQDFEARKAFIAQQNTEILKQQQITQDNAKKKAMDSAASSAATSQASSESSNAQTQGGGMQEIGQTVNTLPPSLETALAGLPPEEAAAIRASVLAEMQASAEAKKQAGLNYADEITAADASQTAYGKVLDQLAKDSKDTKAQIETFLEQSQQTREETLAKQQKSAQDQLSFQENKATRELRKANDKRINQLITAQALGGGFGSSNWNAEVSEAQWNGEQAIADLTTEFGFKRADLDIAYTEQFDTIHEYFGSQKLDALKAHRAEMQQIGQYRFTSTEKTEERKNAAKQNFRNTLAGIAKEHATAIKDASKTIYDTLKEERRFKQQEVLADKRYQNQLDLAEQKAVAAESRAADRQEAAFAKEQRAAERASADDIRSQYDKVQRIEDVANYYTLRGNQAKMTGLLRSAMGSEDPNVIGAVKSLALTMTAKISDPTTGVREGELQKFGKNQTWVQKVKAVNDAMFGGDMTGISLDAVNAYNEMLTIMTNQQRDLAMTHIAPIVSAITTHNNRAEYLPLSPSDVFAGSPEILSAAADAFKSYTRAESRLGQGYNFGDWNGTSASGGLLDTLATAHQKHEGFGSANAKTITKNNNPGALRWTDSQAQFGGVNDGSGFTKFPTYEAGLQALKADLRAKLTGRSAHINYANNPTLLDYVKVYAPAADKNDPGAYAMALVKDLNKAGYNVSLQTPLSTLASLIG